ncbi:hypothetical protein GCM10009830_23390 [Glycomyces endophyticus]|uniref:Uncharacterized protein n=1 Tax=Glycomyces endophyticus TaxID=480996 RepID=A0ABN2GSE7_9ACTN
MAEPFPPAERVELVARAILLRAGIARFQEERRANWDRLAKAHRPTDVSARLQNADDLATLDDALRLMDRAIDLLESPAEDRVAIVAFGIEQLQHRVTELEEYADLKEPLGLLRELIES